MKPSQKSLWVQRTSRWVNTYPHAKRVAHPNSIEGEAPELGTSSDLALCTLFIELFVCILYYIPYNKAVHISDSLSSVSHSSK